MCKEPTRLANGNLVGCRTMCWQCRENYINDWAGRCIAESKVSNYSYFVTLTYGRDEWGDSDHIRAAVLTYSDVDKYFKRVRKTIGKMRYFVAGEYGSEKGRAHWHILMFTEQEFPNVRFFERYMEKHWNYGWTEFRPVTPRRARYCCKYIYKDWGDNLNAAEHHMSLKPPLGHYWFQNLAEQHVEAGIAPQDLFYRFPDVRYDKSGKVINFLMKRKTAENFLQHFIDTWEQKHGISEYTYDDIRFGRNPSFAGKTRIPYSPVIEDYIDKRLLKWEERAEHWKLYWQMVDKARRTDLDGEVGAREKANRRLVAKKQALADQREQDAFLTQKWLTEGLPQLEEHLNAWQEKIDANDQNKSTGHKQSA